jgi:hypothetical protein
MSTSSRDNLLAAESSDFVVNSGFKLAPEDIQPLIPEMGWCYATNHIPVDGLEVGYMYREHPDENLDSGWRFFPGKETQEYVDNPGNSAIYSVNTIANYDPSIIPYLNLPIGSELEKMLETGHFGLINA